MGTGVFEDMSMLDEHKVLRNPIEQFKLWFVDAVTAELPMYEAMTLATSTPDGKPSARIVLLKQADENGFVFYTNYESRKGKELVSNPFASLVFYWNALGRQVRVEGSIEKVSDTESESYFQSRPRESQISAVVSSQSAVVASREYLEEQWKNVEQQFAGKPVQRPKHWGGFRLKPQQIEFWQNRESRLHDRVLYQLQKDGNWKINRLYP